MRILNRTLLVGCVLLLTGAVLMTMLAGFNFLAGSNPAADQSAIEVA